MSEPTDHFHPSVQTPSEMPDKQLTIATYAAGASLAAITLVYVFAPTFFIDGDSSLSTASTRRKTIVGLSNPANDCFINSVLQAMAGLGDLRVYLIRETYRRKLDGPRVYSQVVPDPARKGLPSWKIEGLQGGIVTHGLKEILDALNERPIYKKTISAAPFVKDLEDAFKQRISRQQQDAQEFLQVVAERLCDEYHAGHRARYHAKNCQNREDSNQKLIRGSMVEQSFEKLASGGPGIDTSAQTMAHENAEVTTSVMGYDGHTVQMIAVEDVEDGFPLEGTSESQIECLTCAFKPKPTSSTFCTLTLNVPQVSSTTLSSCFDQMFKTEYIEDFKCEKCRLLHALETFQQELSHSNSDRFRAQTEKNIRILQEAIATNPEDDIKNVQLPDLKFAPKRKIAKHIRITKFPKVMAIHLSRSIFDATRSTMKNSAKVSFSENLPLGGLLSQKIYHLSSVVCHKGSHNSGHYESFRRQTITAPFSTPNTFQPASIYSKTNTPFQSHASTPQIHAMQRLGEVTDIGTRSSTPENMWLASASSSSPSLAGITPSSTQRPRSMSISTMRTIQKASREKDEVASIRSLARSTLSKVPSLPRTKKIDANGTKIEPNTSSIRSSISDAVRGNRKGVSNRWWRISDDKVKESKTAEVLGMQKEVYLLFYELETE